MYECCQIKALHSCPVCGKHTFQYWDSYEPCSVCEWIENWYQNDYPDEDELENIMSLNEARQAYEESRKVL